jgi:hypothetical protein
MWPQSFLATFVAAWAGRAGSERSSANESVEKIIRKLFFKISLLSA